MADNLAKAAARPGADGAVLIAGAGHVRRDYGVPRYLRRLSGGDAMVSLAFVETGVETGAEARDPAAAHGAGDAYDVVWFTAAAPREDPCGALRRRMRQEGGGQRN
jgi:hypothetical protein